MTASDAENKPRVLLRVALRVALVLSVVAALMAAGVLYLLIRGTIEAPEFVRAQVEQGVARAVPDGSLTYDALDIGFDGEARPVVTMRNAVLATPEGEQLLALTDLQATLSLQGILQGQIQPKGLTLAGLFLDVRRDETGAIELSFERDAGNVSLPGAGLAGALARALDQPSLAQLETLEIEAVTLRYDDQRVDRSWTVDGGRLRIGVTVDEVDFFGDFALLSGRASVATVEANAQLMRATGQVAFGVSVTDMPANDLATQQASLAWLSVVDAPISGSLRGGFDADGALQPLSAALKIGAGSIRPNEATAPVPFRAAGSYFTFDPETEVLSFDEVSVDSDWIAFRSAGQAQMVTQTGWLPDRFDVNFTFGDLRSSPGGLWQRDISFDQGAVDFSLGLSPFAMHVTQATLGYGDALLTVKGQLAGEKAGWGFDFRGDLPALTHDELLALWPVTQIEKTRVWLEKNVSGASYSDTVFTLTADAGARAQMGFEAQVDGAEIRYAPTMSAGENVSGTLSLQDSQFVARVESGSIVPLEGQVIDPVGTEFSIADVREKGGFALVKLNGRGPLGAALPLLEQIPGLAADETDLIGLAEGQMSMNGALSFPLGRKPTPEEFIYSVRAQVADVDSDSFLPGQTVTSDIVAVTADNDGVTVQGNAQIGGVDIAATWTGGDLAGGDGSALAGQIELSPDFVAEFGLGLPEGMLTGQGVGVLAVDLPKGEASRFEMVSDLAGVGLDLGFIGWSKPADSKATLTASGQLGDPVQIGVLDIQADGFSASGRVVMQDDGSLDAVEFDTMKIADWLDGSARIIGNGAGQPSDIHITSGRVDVPALTEATGGIGGSSGQQTQGRLITDLDELYVSEFLSLQNLSGSFDLGNNMQGAFEARLNEIVDIAGIISSDDEGRRKFSISADDAGGVFAALGLLDKAAQGSILVELVEKSDGYSGSFRALNMRLLDMPLFADLLNAVSVVGLLDQLNFDGIAFDEVEGEFYFSEDKFILTQASATGASIGISLDGTYDFVNDNLDLQGVLTPVFLVNGIGGIFNRKGEGLIGFNFDVKGPAEDPQIGVNPFSALAPSLFRELFRKPAPTAPE